MAFLPITREEMEARHWDAPDIVLVTGDAYVDHSGFGTAIVSRVLEDAGFRVCILPQPQTDADYTRFGKPKLAFFVNGGNIDSMVAHYTVAKKKRTKDYYTAGGEFGKRPDRAVTVYCNAVRRVYGDIPLCIGGLEASLRRFAHYDYWDDCVRPSILLDTDADLLMFGMGEHQVVEIATRLRDGEPISLMHDIRGTSYKIPTGDYTYIPDSVECPSFKEVKSGTEEGHLAYCKSCRIQQDEHDPVRGKTVIQRHGPYIVIQNPPSMPLTTEELDHVYELPYERNYHPSYEKLGGVPAIEEVKFSITHVRGCYGACNFCAIAYHQGRQITARSEESVIREATALTKLPDFKGYIHDVGGPTADFRKPSCLQQEKHGMCKGRKCLAPVPCKNLVIDHTEYLHMLRKLREIPGVKKVFIRSGIRFDYLIYDKNEEFFKDLVRYHVSGQLRVAPEHCSNNVLRAMGKPPVEVYEKFVKRFYELTTSIGKKQYVVPYLMSSHPGSTLNDAITLSLFLKKEELHPEQVQDFYPTPGTISTCMFYTGLDPYTLKPIYIPKTKAEKAEQRALLQYYRPENREIVLEALKKAGRTDLIGYGENCLVRPDRKKEEAKPNLSKRANTGKNKAKEKPSYSRTDIAKALHKDEKAFKKKASGRKDGWAKPKKSAPNKRNGGKK